jgi:hypothetical protein
VSVSDARPGPADSSAEPAPVDLAWAVDDADHPTELTVYSDREDEITTHWLTVDLEHAVDLEEMA